MTTTLLLIFLNVVLVLYAIVINGRRSLLTFAIIPIFMFTVFYTWNVINYYRGHPISPIPTGQEIQVVAVKVQKPQIFVLLREENHVVPRYYVMPYNQKNQEEMKGLAALTEAGQVLTGKFITTVGEPEKYAFEKIVPNLPQKEPAVQ